MGGPGLKNLGPCELNSTAEQPISLTKTMTNLKHGRCYLRSAKEDA